MVSLLATLLFVTVVIGKTKKIWIDTDLGTDADDSMALLLSLSMYDKDIEIVGISTVATNPKFAARLTAKYVSFLGFTGIPIYYGLWNKTLEDWSQEYNPYIYEQGMDTTEYSYWDEYIQPFPPSSELFNSVDIVYGIGPLTTMSHLFLTSDEYKIRHLIVMGGSILPQPIYNLNASTVLWDYNVRVDPTASWTVLTSDNVDKISFVTGNVTLSCWMDLDNLQSMKDVQSRYAAYSLLIQEIEAWHDHCVDVGLFDGVGINLTEDMVEFLHDPMTVSYGFEGIVEPTWLTMEKSDIAFWINDYSVFETIEMDESTNVEDMDGYVIKKDVMWSKDVDCDAFLDFYFSTVNSFKYQNLRDSNNSSNEAFVNQKTMFAVFFGAVLLIVCSLSALAILCARKRRYRAAETENVTEVEVATLKQERSSL